MKCRHAYIAGFDTFDDDELDITDAEADILSFAQGVEDTIDHDMREPLSSIRVTQGLVFLCYLSRTVFAILFFKHLHLYLRCSKLFCLS